MEIFISVLGIDIDFRISRREPVEPEEEPEDIGAKHVALTHATAVIAHDPAFSMTAEECIESAMPYYLSGEGD